MFNSLHVCMSSTLYSYGIPEGSWYTSTHAPPGPQSTSKAHVYSAGGEGTLTHRAVLVEPCKATCLSGATRSAQWSTTVHVSFIIVHYIVQAWICQSNSTHMCAYATYTCTYTCTHLVRSCLLHPLLTKAGFVAEGIHAFFAGGDVPRVARPTGVGLEGAWFTVDASTEWLRSSDTGYKEGTTHRVLQCLDTLTRGSSQAA